MPRHSNLDDPEYARNAWARYWRLMRGMALLTLVCVALAFALIFYQFGFANIHMYIATAGGIFFAIMLTAGLMGLVFLSSGTGHDDSIDDPVSQDISPDE